MSIQESIRGIAGASTRQTFRSALRPLERLTDPLRSAWRDLSLSRQFAIVAASVILLGMSAIGTWVVKRIETGVTDNSAAAAALYMDALIAPAVQELGSTDRLSAESRAKLDQIFQQPEFRESIAAFKVWLRDGTIAFSNYPELIGQKFARTPNFEKAWKGVVSAHDSLGHDDEERERALGVHLIEIYAPIRESSSNRIIAVSEFYMRADQLDAALRTARLQSWAIVGLTGLLMTLALYAVVRRGSRTIEDQRASLEMRVVQNEELGQRLERAYWRADKLNEQFLRGVGADLHDGPAQLLGLALMRIDDLPIDRNAANAESTERVFEVVHGALEEAIREIRNLSRGLILPELDKISVNEMAMLLANLHEERTGSAIGLHLPDEPIDVAKEFKVCAYRFIQEALNNGHRHAPGSTQSVAITINGTCLEILVSDDGPGIKNLSAANGAVQLGLAGIRDRVETLNGQLVIATPEGGGTELRVTLDTSREPRIEV